MEKHIYFFDGATHFQTHDEYCGYWRIKISDSERDKMFSSLNHELYPFKRWLLTTQLSRHVSTENALQSIRSQMAVRRRLPRPHLDGCKIADGTQRPRRHSFGASWLRKSSAQSQEGLFLSWALRAERLGNILSLRIDPFHIVTLKPPERCIVYFCARSIRKRRQAVIKGFLWLTS